MAWNHVAKVLLLAVALTPLLASSAHATDARSMDNGRIIDDAIFTNNDTMTVWSIQFFLNTKVPLCDTMGQKTSELGGGTRKQYLAAHGIQVPITCLRDYYENPSTGENNYGKAIPAGGISAAQIIWNYSQQFGINPQVLLATLQKENGLVTDEWPTPRQYTQAMGFGCPDHLAPGAPACDPAYSSFSTQIYQAARHFRNFIDNTPGWWIPFSTGVNSIAWNPNGACGASNVNIQNRSTVALYSYTPYQPNQNAKNAQWASSSDGCSSYGNRNFYLYFTEWFGPTTFNSTLVRTLANSTVYLTSDVNIGGTMHYMKYPIGDINILNSLNLGGVGFVSQAYLDMKESGPLLGRAVVDSAGTVYYFDVGIKLPFSSCGLVADYGYSCGAAARLSDWQINTFLSGPAMTSFYGTTTGKTFYIKDGEKREVFDEPSKTSLGIPGGYNVITETAISNLPYGAPVARDGVIILDRQTGDRYIKDQGQLTRVDEQTRVQTWVGKTHAWLLDNASLNQMTKTSSFVQGFAQDQTSGDKFVFTAAGKIKLTNPSVWTATFPLLSQTFMNTIPTVGTEAQPYLIKSPSNSTVYYMESQKKRAMTAWADVAKISPSSNILTIPDFIVNSIPDGLWVLKQGSLVKSPTSATVYFVDGLGGLVPISSFTVASEAGVPTNVVTMPQSTIDGYTVSPSTLKALLQCSGTKYLSIGGRLNKLSGAQDSAMGLTYQTITLCPASAIVDLPGNFFLDRFGTIYQVVGGQKRPITSWSTYIGLGGNTSNTVRVSDVLLNDIPTGAAL